MENFNSVVEKLGWNKPYVNVSLWFKERDSEHLMAVFDIGGYAESTLIDEKYVINTMDKWFPKTIFKAESKNWVLPLLTSDYFAHKYDFENELIWAKKAIEENSNLTPLQFSSKIRELL